MEILLCLYSYTIHANKFLTNIILTEKASIICLGKVLIGHNYVLATQNQYWGSTGPWSYTYHVSVMSIVVNCIIAQSQADSVVGEDILQAGKQGWGQHLPNKSWLAWNLHYSYVALANHSITMAN